MPIDYHSKTMAHDIKTIDECSGMRSVSSQGSRTVFDKHEMTHKIMEDHGSC